MKDQNIKYVRHYENQKDKILQDAKLLFMEKGIQKTTIADIALACNMTRATIYHYFPNKEEILRSIFYLHMTQFNRLMRDALKEATTTYERFIQASNIFMEQAKSNQEYFMYTQIFQEYYLRTSSSPDFSSENEYNEDHIKPGDLVYSLVENFHDGSVDPSLDPLLTTMSFIYNCNYIVRCAFDNQQAFPLKYNVHAFDYIHHSIKIQLEFLKNKNHR